MIAFIASKYRPRISRNDSESRRSPSAVDPFRSQNRMLTVLRTSLAIGAASGVPQYPQTRNLSGLSSRQFGHTAMRKAYAAFGNRPVRMRAGGVLQGRAGSLVRSVRS